MKFVSAAVSLLTVAIFVNAAPSVNEDEAGNSVHEGIPQTSDSSETESKGYFQYITDTVKEYTVNKVTDMFKNMPGMNMELLLIINFFELITSRSHELRY